MQPIMVGVDITLLVVQSMAATSMGKCHYLNSVTFKTQEMGG